MKIRQKDKENFILFCVLLFFIGMAVVSVIWNANGYYTRAYTPVVNEARERHAINHPEERSKQPRARGFRESEIKKHHGDRFSTY